MSETLYGQAQRYLPETVALRRWFHEHPEPSFGERATAERIREELTRLEIPFEEAGGTGTVATIRGASGGPVLALRADIDALEIEEKNDVAYRSQNAGLMHACGHDAHAAALLTAAKLLKERSGRLPGTVKLIFQPAEEVGRGAKAVIDSGLVNDVDAFFGIHVRAGLPVGKIALKAGPVMGGANTLHIEIEGKSGHAGHPDGAVDAIAAGCALVESLQHIVSREVSPTDPAVVSVCQFHAGTRDNIVANLVRISGTARIADEAVRTQVADAVRRIAAGVSAAHRVTARVDCEFTTPVLANDAALYELAVAAARDILPNDAAVGLVPQLGTEDFSFYGAIAPVFFAFVGSGGSYPHHHERFDVEEEALAVSAALHAAFAFRYLESGIRKERT